MTMPIGSAEHSLAHELVHALGWTLLHFCWQGALVALVLWCVLGLLAGRSSQVRYGAACFALALLVAMPLVTFAHIASVEYRMRASDADSAIVIDPGMLLQVGAGDSAAPWPVRMAMVVDHWTPWLLAAWFAGAIFFVARLNFGLMVARRLRRESTEAPSVELLQRFDALRLRLGVVRAVSLLHSARVQVPTVIGWLRPVVLIPASCLTGLSPEQIEAILCHELAHVRRHDYLVSVFQSVAEALLFYHPAVWWVSKQVRRERECCCDEVAVRSGGDVLAYARALSYLEERRAAFPEFVLGANGGVLTMRIKRLLGCKEDAQASQLAAFALLALMLAGAGSYAVSVAHAQPKGIVEVAQLGLRPANPQMALSDRAVAAGVASFMPQSAAPSAANAQEDGAIAGVIVDPTGALVPRASVRVSNTETRVTMAKVTDNSGTYSLAPLPPGRYNVEVSANGFQRLLQTDVQVDGKQKVVLNLRLKVGPVDQALSVQGSPVAVASALPPPVVAPTAQPNGRPLRVSAGVVAGNALAMVQPVYPEEAKANHVQGSVVLHAIISKTGDVENLSVISGPPPLIVSAIDAVRQWKYKPYLLNGEPTAVETTVTVNYTLGPDAGEPNAARMEPPPPGSSQSDDHNPVRVSPGVVAGNLISHVNPVYPADAKAAHLQGAVVLRATISKTGTVEELRVVSGPPQLTKSALDAVKQWVYKPYLLNGEPVEVQTTITVNFTFADPAPPPAQGALQEYGGEPVRKIGGGVSSPVPVFESQPEYSKEAKKAKLNGIVLVNLIVDAEGMPQNVHVLRGVGMGLDEKAVEAVQQYKFKPATEGGKPVPVNLNIEVNFKIF